MQDRFVDTRPRWTRLLAGALVAALAFGASPDAAAQTTTGSLRGTVTSTAGQPVSDVTVAARNVEQNVSRGALTNESGFYFMGGIRPGRYEVTVRRVGFTPQSRTVQVGIGQTIDVNFQVAESAVQLEAVTVVAAPAVETRTSEVATNITQEQIQSLPQQDRNFLNFAGLAPGVTVSREEQNKQIRAGGLPASKINVFVDGASYKNDILEGGVHGQDASRGNPFPQLAIQEFRVVTQNFKAEYQRAASAVVTATTRTGTNDLQVDAFILGQNKGLVTKDPGVRLECRNNPDNCPDKPEYERLQLGVSAGFPLVRDRLFFFGGYEGNIQNRENIVSLGRPEFRPQFGEYEGTFGQPFRSHLPFGKLTWQSGNQTIDLSYNGRIESDKRGFGGTTSFESAENVEIGYHVVTLQHGWARDNWFNQAHISAQRSTWNPTVVNQSQDIGREYQNVIRIGARDTEQKFTQDRIALRNDITYSGFQWAGNHVFKMGGNVDFLNYDVEKRFNGNPVFVFNPDQSLTVPIEARYGLGNPGMDERNVQFGLFIQDDWDVTERLQLNLGVRWDAETNLFNNDWVTPDSIRQQFAGGITPLPGQDFASFSPGDYFTDGSEDRPMFLGAFQPRVGFSFDVAGSGRTVLHGGFGIYYDREIWNRLLDERFRLQWRNLTFPFTTTGEPGRIAWDDSYLSREGLESILTQANPPGLAEVFLLDNDTKPTKSHQWNLGVRQVVGPLTLGAAYRGVRGYNVFSWHCATPHSVHGFCEGLLEQSTPNFRGLILSTDEGRTTYDAFDVTFEKPMLGGSRWGATFAYTIADGKRKGADFFTLDYPGVDPEDWPEEDQAIERHRVVASGIVGLPAGFQLSTMIQWGSGIPYNRIDEINGWGPARRVVDFASEDPPSWNQVDLRLNKDFLFAGNRIGLMVEAINLFDEENFRGYHDLYRFEGGAVNESFGQPQPWTSDTGRRFQLGLTYGFGRSFAGTGGR